MQVQMFQIVLITLADAGEIRAWLLIITPEISWNGKS